MVDALDLLQCPVCGTFYVPPARAPMSEDDLNQCFRYCPECSLSRGQLIEQGYYVVGSRLTEDVVDPLLTGSIVDVEV